MIYTVEQLTNLSLDEVKDIAAHKSHHGIVPCNFGKNRLISEIIHFQLEYGDTEIKEAPSLKVGDMWLGGGILFEDADVQYSAWYQITLINIQPLSKEEIKELIKSPLVPSVISLSSLGNRNKYIITYNTISLKFDGSNWEKCQSDMIDTIVAMSNHRFIVKTSEGILQPSLTIVK